jgi:hypothetical protein
MTPAISVEGVNMPAVAGRKCRIRFDLFLTAALCDHAGRHPRSAVSCSDCEGI